jgi:hypothetical protein
MNSATDANLTFISATKQQDFYFSTKDIPGPIYMHHEHVSHEHAKTKSQVRSEDKIHVRTRIRNESGTGIFLHSTSIHRATKVEHCKMLARRATDGSIDHAAAFNEGQRPRETEKEEKSDQSRTNGLDHLDHLNHLLCFTWLIKLEK